MEINGELNACIFNTATGAFKTSQDLKLKVPNSVVFMDYDIFDDDPEYV